MSGTKDENSKDELVHINGRETTRRVTRGRVFYKESTFLCVAPAVEWTCELRAMIVPEGIRDALVKHGKGIVKVGDVVAAITKSCCEGFPRPLNQIRYFVLTARAPE